MSLYIHNGCCKLLFHRLSSDTSDLQSAHATFFGNNVFLTCSFAGGSTATGCRFMFQVNQNGTESEEFILLRSMSGEQCNVTANQLNGYMGISAVDLGSDQVTISVTAVMVSSEVDFTSMTGCVTQEGT